MLVIKPEPMYYDWGDSSLVNRYFELSVPSSVNLAELWMGAHPRAASRILNPTDQKPIGDATLLDLITNYPELLSPNLKQESQSQLNSEKATAPTPGLPFLFKILSARKALSIQAHPSLDQAREGWQRENKANIPTDAPNRNYRDANHKPECMFALSYFWALRGFREPMDIREDFEPIIGGLPHLVNSLTHNKPGKALSSFLTLLLQLKNQDLEYVLGQLRQTAMDHLSGQGIQYSSDEDLLDAPQTSWRYIWTLRLMDQYPGDPGALAPLYLRVFCLRPGQAVVLPAGVLHAYLSGIGLEAMANSDNVLRAGCTGKHVDVAELLRVVDFSVDTSTPTALPSDQFLETGFPEFKILVHTSQSSRTNQDSLELSAQPGIVLCTEGRICLSYAHEPAQNPEIPGFTSTCTLQKGQAVFLPAAAGSINITGVGNWAVCSGNA